MPHLPTAPPVPSGPVLPGVLEPEAVRHLVVHCSATPDAEDIGAREIHAMHLGFGWHGIGYHRVVRRDGRVEAGRPDCWIGAHVRGHNEVSLGVCLIGCETFGDAQLDALEGVLRDWQRLCPDAVIRGHRDFAYTEKTCPNFDVGAWCVTRGLQAPLADVPVPDRAVADHALSGRDVPACVLPDRAADGRGASDRVATERIAHDRSAPDRVRSDRAPDERVVPEEAPPDRT